MKRWIVLLAVLSLAVAACGGSDDSGAADSDEAVTTTQAPSAGESGDEDTPTETTSSENESDEGDTSDTEGTGPSTATVTLGEETYQFSTEGAIVAQCLTDLFGVFSVQLPMIDD
ncbi:MAG: hypothetical protein PVF87_11700, partial [Acidimicrobiia bacterium]